MQRNSLRLIVYLWSIDTRAKSNLCLLLNITSFCGISNRDGGPNGVHMANNASGGSSDFLFCPCNTLTRPLISNLFKIQLILKHLLCLRIKKLFYLPKNRKCCLINNGSALWNSFLTDDNFLVIIHLVILYWQTLAVGTNSTLIVFEVPHDLLNVLIRILIDVLYPTKTHITESNQNFL